MASYDFPESVVARGASFEATGPAEWWRESSGRRLYRSGKVVLQCTFDDLGGYPRVHRVQWHVMVKGDNFGRYAGDPSAALDTADLAAIDEIKLASEGLADAQCRLDRMVSAQEALLHPSDYACERCRAEVTSVEATGVICRACFDSGPSKCRSVVLVS